MPLPPIHRRLHSATSTGQLQSKANAAFFAADSTLRFIHGLMRFATSSSMTMRFRKCEIARETSRATANRRSTRRQDFEPSSAVPARFGRTVLALITCSAWALTRVHERSYFPSCEIALNGATSMRMNSYDSAFSAFRRYESCHSPASQPPVCPLRRVADRSPRGDNT